MNIKKERIYRQQNEVNDDKNIILLCSSIGKCIALSRTSRTECRIKIK
jgi:hypothetical protein